MLTGGDAGGATVVCTRLRAASLIRPTCGQMTLAATPSTISKPRPVTRRVKRTSTSASPVIGTADRSWRICCTAFCNSLKWSGIPDRVYRTSLGGANASALSFHQSPPAPHPSPLVPCPCSFSPSPGPLSPCLSSLAPLSGFWLLSRFHHQRPHLFGRRHGRLGSELHARRCPGRIRVQHRLAQRQALRPADRQGGREGVAGRSGVHRLDAERRMCSKRLPSNRSEPFSPSLSTTFLAPRSASAAATRRDSRLPAVGSSVRIIASVSFGVRMSAWKRVCGTWSGGGRRGAVHDHLHAQALGQADRVASGLQRDLQLKQTHLGGGDQRLGRLDVLNRQSSCWPRRPP